MSQNLSSAAVVIGALRVKTGFNVCYHGFRLQVTEADWKIELAGILV